MTARISNQFVVRFVIGVLIFCIGAVLIWFFKSLAATFALAVVVYLIIDAPTRMIQHQGISRGLSICIVLLVVHIVLLSGLLFMGSSVYDDIDDIRKGLPDLRNRLEGTIVMLEGAFPSLEVKEYLTPERLEQIQTYLVSIITSALGFLSTWIFNVVFIIPLLTTLLLATGHKLKVIFFDLVPNSYFEMSVTVYDNIMNTIREYISAKFLESFLISIMCIAGFLLIGMPGAIVLGILAGVLNLIPYFGPLISLIPPAIMAILNEDITLALGAAIVIGLAQLVDNVVLQPVLVSKAVNAHPLIVVLVTFMGAELFGPVGMVIAIPFYTISKILFVNLYHFLGSVQRRSILEEKEQAMVSIEPEDFSTV